MSSQQISIKNVLCPTDFMASSGNALELASAIAGWFRAKLTVLHVIPYAPQAQSSPSLVLSRSEVDYDLKNAIAARAKPGAQIETEIREGEPWREIESRAAALKADLVVMGNEGRSGWQRLLIGSTTEKVMRRLNCPVLAVGPMDLGPRGLLFKRILCAVDLTASSRETSELAFALAEENLAEVTLLHVLDGSPIPSKPAEPPNGSRSAPDLLVEDDAKARLRSLVELRWTFCRTGVSVAKGTAWREIVRVANEIRADLIVTGAHGEGASGTSFLGSTADQVLRHAACPVLLAKPRAPQASATRALTTPTDRRAHPGKARVGEISADESRRRV
jgi:nucleotide-binding universal stress UspA family protein